MEDPGTAYVDANFDWYQPFESIPGALWFSLVTITAVGYGEYFPVTPSGRTVAAIVALVSQIIFALPITVIGSNYATAFREQARLRLIANPHPHPNPDPNPNPTPTPTPTPNQVQHGSE